MRSRRARCQTAPIAAPRTYHQRGFFLPPGATEIVLVRHGSSEPAVAGQRFPLLDGHGDPALAPEGEVQAALVAERLAGEPLSGLFVTPLKRTAQTAAPLAARLGLEPVVVPDLIEVFLGDWDGGEFRVRLSEGDPIALQAVEEERWDLIPGAESMEAFAVRVRAGIETVIAGRRAGRLGGRHRARGRHRRGLPAGHGEPAVRVRAQRERLAVAARRPPRRSLAAALVQRHGALASAA